MDDPIILRELIERTFVTAVYPGDDNLWRSYDPVIDEFMEYLTYKDWRTFLAFLLSPPADLKFCRDNVVFFMTPAAIHYYTPAFLILCLSGNSDTAGYGFWGRLVKTSQARSDRCVEAGLDRPKFVMSCFEDLHEVLNCYSLQEKLVLARMAHWWTRYSADYEQEPKSFEGDLRGFWRGWLIDD